VSYVLAAKNIPQVDIALFERDFFDGAQFLLQDENGSPINLDGVVVCSSIYKVTTAGSTLVTSFNTEKLEPYRNGQVRLWLTSSQTVLVASAYEGAQQKGGATVFFPTAYSSQADSASFYEGSNLRWDLRIETPDTSVDLISAASGTFITQVDHGFASTDRVVFSGTTSTAINYNGTSNRLYSNLTGISYLPPYSFAISALSGVTNAAIGGSVYRLKQDTVVVGNVIVNSTNSNCFP
jgi:hypothetical protein